MPLDSVCLSAIKDELCSSIIGLRVDKIQQPERDEVVLLLRGRDGARRLLMCAGSGNARVHLTDETLENPMTPPMFCMLLRKHLTGAKIVSVTQPEMERMLDIEFEATDNLGDRCGRHIILEFMGRYSNIILTDGDGRITDCLCRVGGDISDTRPVMPGLYYRLPPSQGKLDPLRTDSGEIKKLLDGADGGKQVYKWILDTFCGLSPLICREVAFRACGEADARINDKNGRDATASELSALFTTIKNRDFSPVMLTDGSGRPVDFSYMEIRQYGKLYVLTAETSFSGMLERYYSKREKAERIRQRGQSLIKTARNARDRVARKLANQRQELLATGDREKLRRAGDIITSNLYRMEKGMRLLKAEDFYSEDGRETEIKLDELKTPQQNAAKYYKDYNRAKTAEMYLTEQIAVGERELAYLNSVLEELEKAEGERDLAEIRQELIDTGYLKSRNSGKKEKRIEQRPMHFVSDTGTDIWVGKNNAQNERLTHRMAMKRDVWLHAQKIHGSHVVIQTGGGEPDEVTLSQAASLAAFYSQSGAGAKVPVDYTLVKNVKKMPGGKPGMVTYTDYKTVTALADEKTADRIRQRN